jgi:hypothetical protein
MAVFHFSNRHPMTSLTYTSNDVTPARECFEAMMEKGRNDTFLNLLGLGLKLGLGLRLGLRLRLGLMLRLWLRLRLELELGLGFRLDQG